MADKTLSVKVKMDTTEYTKFNQEVKKPINIKLNTDDLKINSTAGLNTALTASFISSFNKAFKQLSTSKVKVPKIKVQTPKFDNKNLAQLLENANKSFGDPNGLLKLFGMSNRQITFLKNEIYQMMEFEKVTLGAAKALENLKERQELLKGLSEARTSMANSSPSNLKQISRGIEISDINMLSDPANGLKSPMYRRDVEYLNEVAKSSGKLREELKQQQKANEKANKALEEMEKASKKTKEATGGLLTNIKSIVGGMLLFKGITAIFSEIKDSITTASDITEALNISSRAFNGADLTEWGLKMGNAFNVAQVDAHTFVGTMAEMLQSMNVSRPYFEEMSKNLAQLSGDLASFYNKTPEQMFTKLRSGMSGISTAMKQIGINMNVSVLDEWLKGKGFDVNYNSLSLASKELVRYNYIMEKTRDIQGDYVKTSGSWANQTRRLSLEWQNFKQIIGAGLIAALTPVLRVVNELLSSLTAVGKKIAQVFNINLSNPTGQSGGYSEEMSDIGEAADEASEKVAQFEKQLMGFDRINNITKPSENGTSALKDINMPLADYKNITAPYKALYDTLKKLKPLITSFKDGWKVGFGDAGKLIQDTINKLKQIGLLNRLIFSGDVKQMLKDISFSIGEILGALSRIVTVIANSAVTGYLRALEKRVGSLRSNFKLLFTDIGSIFKDIGTIFKDLADVIEAQGPVLTKAFTGIFGIVMDAIRGAVVPIVDIAAGIINGIKTVFDENKEVISETLTNIFTPAATVINEISQLTKQLADSIIKNVNEVVRPVLESFFSFVSEGLNGFLTGFNKALGKFTDGILPVSELRDLIKQAFDNKVINDCRDALIEVFNVMSPMFKEVSKFFGMGFGRLIKNTLQSIVSLMKAVGNTVSGAISIVKVLYNVIAGVLHLIIFDGDGAAEHFKAAWKNVQDFWKTFCDNLKSLFGGVADTIKNFFNDIVDWFGKIGNGIKNLFSGSSSGRGGGGSLPRMAAGGIATRSTIANIGEAGAEAVIPLKANVLQEIGKGIASTMQNGAVANNNSNITINSNFNASKFLDYTVQQGNRRSAAFGVL